MSRNKQPLATPEASTTPSLLSFEAPDASVTTSQSEATNELASSEGVASEALEATTAKVKKPRAKRTSTKSKATTEDVDGTTTEDAPAKKSRRKSTKKTTEISDEEVQIATASRLSNYAVLNDVPMASGSALFGGGEQEETSVTKVIVSANTTKTNDNQAANNTHNTVNSMSTAASKTDKLTVQQVIPENTGVYTTQASTPQVAYESPQQDIHAPTSYEQITDVLNQFEQQPDNALYPMTTEATTDESQVEHTPVIADQSSEWTQLQQEEREWQVLEHQLQQDISEPTGKFTKPQIDFSTSFEQYEERRVALMATMSEYARLTRFEVDLYTTYPQLIPDHKNKKNGIRYVKHLHELNFDFVFFDTETTGMNREPGARSVAEGHRVITLGMVPFINGTLLDDPQYCIDMQFNPEQDIDIEASKVHGIYNQDLVHAPLFRSFIPQLRHYISGKVLCAHNANFDITFINAELERAGENWRIEDVCLVIDSLALARNLTSGHANLDALSRKFNVNIARDYHGALLDSIILGHVYQAMLQSYQDQLLDLSGEQGTFENPINIVPLQNIDITQLLSQVNKLQVPLTEADILADKEFTSTFKVIEEDEPVSEQEEELLDTEHDIEDELLQEQLADI